MFRSLSCCFLLFSLLVQLGKTSPLIPFSFTESTSCSGKVQLDRILAKKGFHRELETSFQLKTYPTDWNLNQCDTPTILFVEYFPAEVFLDLYQIGEKERLGLVKYQTLTPEMDLEKPAYHPNVSSSHVGVLFSSNKIMDSRWNISLPIHLRYQKPSQESLFSTFTIPKPKVFLTCSNEPTRKASTMSVLNEDIKWHQICVSPFENQNARDLEITDKIPVGSLQDTTLVTAITLGVTLFASLCLVYLLSFLPSSSTTKQHRE